MTIILGMPRKPFKGVNDEETEALIGAAIQVHRTLGYGFLEAIYRKALCIELANRAIPAREEVGLPIFYEGRNLGIGYRADILCFESIVVEIKAQANIGDADFAQVIHYLRASNLQRALLLNFGTSKLQIRRFVLTRNTGHTGVEDESLEVAADSELMESAASGEV